jgi:Ca2+/H+ antiporter, TMEM165/GDT1 family
MDATWAHAAPSLLAAFFASLVECVEALTIVLAIGAVRGWRSALSGSGAALTILLVIVVALGPALARIPIDIMQVTIGALLLLFGMRWLRKAILRAAGVVPLHDEAAAFAKETARLCAVGGTGRWDWAAAFGSFQITMLEGIEVAFIVVAIGAGGSADLLMPASLGALAALLLVIALGLVLHRPLASIPENGLKFVVGILLAAFGTFWVGEGLGISWPGADWAILGLAIGFLLAAVLTAWLSHQKVLQVAALVTGMERA